MTFADQPHVCDSSELRRNQAEPAESRLVAALHNARCAGGGRCDPRGGVAGYAMACAWGGVPRRQRRRRTASSSRTTCCCSRAPAAPSRRRSARSARQPGWAALWFTYAARDVGATSQAPPAGGPDRELWPLGDVARGAPAPATAEPHFNTLVGSAAACYPGRAAGGHCAGGAADDPHCAADHPGARCGTSRGTFYALSRRGPRALRVVAREGLYEAADEVLSTRAPATAGCGRQHARPRKPAARSVRAPTPGWCGDQ